MSAPRAVVAKSGWSPAAKELEALKRHSHVTGLSRVDGIWPWLAAHHGTVVAVDAPHAAHPERFSYAELAQRIEAVAAAFHERGVRSGDVVALFAENSPRWLVADQGLMRVGAADAVRGASAPVEELRYILEDCQAVALVVQNAELWQRLQLSSEQRQRLRFVLQLEGTPADGLIGFDALLATGSSSSGVALDRSGDAVATILYTSGTTGQPKGVPLRHSNLLHQMRSLACVAYPAVGAPVLSVLPIWHAYERSASYYFFPRLHAELHHNQAAQKRSAEGPAHCHGNGSPALGGDSGWI